MGIASIFAKNIITGESKKLSAPSVRIAIISIIISVVVMLASVGILTGFKKEIREKLAGFTSHIKIGAFSQNTSPDAPPINTELIPVNNIKNIRGIRHIQAVIYKTAILQTKEHIQGIILKGTGNDFDTSFLRKHLVRGRIYHNADTVKKYELMISEKMALQLKTDTGQKVTVFFISEQNQTPQVRRFTICGIYDTGLEDFDQNMAFCDIAHLRHINKWKTEEATCLEVYLNHDDDLDDATHILYNLLPADINVSNMKENYPQIFDWLQLQDINVIVIMVLMIAVTVMAISSALLILIVEKTREIGILKAMGATHCQLRLAFLIVVAYITSIGLLWGNIIGIGLLKIQEKFHLIPLPKASYYMDYVPVHLEAVPVMLINLFTLLICVLAVLLPNRIIHSITPLKAIRFK